MAKIIPFKAVRPPRDKAHLVASRSYVTYKMRHLNRKLMENPYSFIHIINPEFGTTGRSKPNSTARFKKIKKKFEAFCKSDILVQDSEEAFYIYNQITPENSFTGIICGVHVKEYLEGHIKVHEHTLTSRVETFTNYLDVCDFNAEPVLLTFANESSSLEEKILQLSQARAEYDFTTTDRIRHQLWPVTEEEEISFFKKEFEKVECLYIADGHHRMASSAHLGDLRKERKGWHADHISNYALALLIPDNQLSIKPFHRILKLESPIDRERLLGQIAKDYIVKPCDSCYLPAAPKEFGMRLKSGWYKLKLREEVSSHSVVAHLDPMILTHTILEPIFGIYDQKTDTRIAYIPGNEKLDLYERAIDEGISHIMFTLYPISTGELFEVSDAGEIMPPKSTYVEPKLRSGLTIMKLS